MFIPVRIFHYNFYFGVSRFCRTDDERLCCFSHKIQTVLCPAFAAFVFYSAIVLTIRKKEIVQNKFIKIFGSVFAQLFYFLSVVWITVTKCLKTVGLADG